MNHSYTADILKQGFLLKYFPAKRVIDWAYNLVAKGETNDLIIDLSTTDEKSVNNIISLLNELSNKDPLTKDLCKKFFFSYFRRQYEKKKIPLSELEFKLVDFYNLNMVDFTEDERYSLSIIANDYSLKQGGLSGSLDISLELKNFLFRYNYFDNSILHLSELDLGNLFA